MLHRLCPVEGLWHRSNKRRATDSPREFYAHAVGAVQEIRDFMRTGNYDRLSSIEKVTIVTGQAAFVDAHAGRVD